MEIGHPGFHIVLKKLWKVLCDTAEFTYSAHE